MYRRGLDLPQNIGNVGEPGVEEMQSIQRRQGTALSYLLVWLLGFFLFFLGSLLESYVNPLFLRAVLKNI